MGKPSAPAAPDYTGAAEKTAAGNLETAKYTTEANRINQYTPQGSVTYANSPTTTFDQAGYDRALADYNAKMTQGGEFGQLAGNLGAAPDRGQFTKETPNWSQTVTLSPDQQKLYDQNVGINQQLGNVAQQGVGYVQQALNQPLSTQGMQAIQDPNTIQQQASDAAYQNATRYLDPQFQRQQAGIENQLANQGITRGSEAWNNAMQQQDMTRQQAYEGARNQAYLQGLQGSGQLYSQGMGNRQQQLSEAQLMQQNPINMLNAVRTGSQMQVAQQPQVGVSNPGMMGQVAGPDYLGATSATGQYNQGLYNAQSAQQNALVGGLFSLGAGGLSGGYF